MLLTSINLLFPKKCLKSKSLAMSKNVLIWTIGCTGEKCFSYEAGDLSRLYFSLCRKRGENSDFPIFADLGSVSVVWIPKFANFHISPLRTWICTPLSANFTNFAVLKIFHRQTFTKKRNFHQIMGIVYLNHLLHMIPPNLAEIRKIRKNFGGGVHWPRGAQYKRLNILQASA